MAKRQLDQTERNICLKAIEKYKKIQRILKTDLENLDFWIVKGLHNSYIKAMEEKTKERRNKYEEIHEAEMMTHGLQDQIDNGVEIKENIKEDIN